MELVEYPIDINSLDGGPFVLAPLGDIQWDGTPHSTAVSHCKTHIDRALSRDAKFLGMGDYTDFASPSNRQRLVSAGLYDTAMNVIDAAGVGLVDGVMKSLLEPTIGKWIGMLEGHHFLQFQNGITSDQLLCQRLGTRFLGTSAYIGLKFMEGRHVRGHVNVWLHHGVGSGMSAAAPVQKLEQVASVWSAHIYLIGHMTKRAAAPISQMYPEWGKKGTLPRLKHVERYLVGTGGFSRAYQEGSMQGNVQRGGYVEKGMMKPTVLGAPLITIHPHMVNRQINGSRHNYFQPVIHVEV